MDRWVGTVDGVMEWKVNGQTIDKTKGCIGVGIQRQVMNE